MKTLTDQLTQYAYYHQDQRNINTHFVGVPMIVMAVVILMSRAQINLGGVLASLAMVAAVLTTIFICVRICVLAWCWVSRWR